MEDQQTLNAMNTLNSSGIYSKIKHALNLINEGKETEAHNNFPWEYHFIKKYYAPTFEELIQLLTRKLEVF